MALRGLTCSNMSCCQCKRRNTEQGRQQLQQAALQQQWSLLDEHAPRQLARSARPQRGGQGHQAAELKATHG